MSDAPPPVRLPPRPADSHKGTFGTVLVVAGSRGMSGAAVLCGRAALTGGAGLVRVATSQSCQSVVAAGEPAYTTIPLPEDRSGRIQLGAIESLRGEAARATVLACGPGWGRSPGLDFLAVRLHREIEQPIVWDADALNALAARPDSLAGAAGARVLTPHPGEFARLLGYRPPNRQAACDAARALAKEHGCVVLLKGNATFVTDGDRGWANDTGNPGMATGGAGDVLTGLLAACIAQGLPPYEAACYAAHVHGAAGDAATEALGEQGVTAERLIDFLPGAMRPVA